MIRPFADNLLVKIATDEFKFGGDRKGIETGVVIEVPETLLWFGYHSFAFESSYAGTLANNPTVKMYRELLGKQVIWETLQDRGRRFKHDGQEYILLKMSDVIGFTDEVSDEVQTVSDSNFNPGGM